MYLQDLTIADKARMSLRWDTATSKVIDITGNTAAITPSATAKPQAPWTGGSAASLFYDGTYTVTVPTATFNKAATDTAPFTYEFVLYPAGAGNVFVHPTGGDGLKITGTVLSFSQTRAGGVTDTVSYDFIQPQVLHVVVVYDTKTLTMYVNGDVATVNVSSALLSSTETTTQFNGGVVDLFTYYNFAMLKSQANKHFAQLSQNYNFPYFTKVYRVSDNDRAKEVVKTWDTDWSTATLNNAQYTTAGVFPKLDTSGNTVLSTVYLTVGRPNTNTFYGFKPEWLGTGTFTVEYTLDGSTWIAATNRKVIASTVNAAFPSITFRVTFPAGSAVRPLLSSFRIVGYDTNTVFADMPRPITLTGPVSTGAYYERAHKHMLYSGLWISNSSFQIASPTDDTMAVRGVEMWVTLTDNQAVQRLLVNMGASQPTVNISATNKLQFGNSATAYVNGVNVATAAYTFQIGVPTHIVILANNADLTDVVTFGNTASPQLDGAYFHRLALVTAMSATDAANLFNSYTRPPKLTLTDGASPAVTESAGAYVLYNKTWTTQPSLTR